MLHLIAFPPSRRDLIELLQRVVNEGDDLVLLEQGVLGAADSAMARALRDSLPGANWHALDADIQTLAIQPSNDCPTIDYQGLVALTERHAGSMSWYP